MSKTKGYVPNWIEITPGVWISLRRANIIKLRGGGEIQVDGESYKPQQSVLEAIERWLTLRSVKTS
jgi:hypothetical protein